MTISTALTFAVVALFGILTPGPTVLLALTNGSRFGVARACVGMMGSVASDFLLIGAVGLGLGAVLSTSEFAFNTLKWLGVGYLAYLGFKLMFSPGNLGNSPKVSTPRSYWSPLKVLTKSFFVAVTNPKGYLLFTAFLPQFIDPSKPQLQQYAILACIFASIDFMVMVTYASIGARFSQLLKSSGAALLDRICGTIMLTLAGSLALYRRAGL